MRCPPALRGCQFAILVYKTVFDHPVLHNILHGTHPADRTDIVTGCGISLSLIIHTNIYQLLSIVGILVRRCLDIGIDLGFQRFCGLIHLGLTGRNRTVCGIDLLGNIRHILCGHLAQGGHICCSILAELLHFFCRILPVQSHLLREPGTHRPVFFL